MLFSDVIGQDQIKVQLQRAVEEQRVSHAQLFLGPSGSGNLAMALAFAQYLNCENKQHGDSCGTCPGCTKAQKWIHPDIHFTFPVFKVDKKETCADWMPEWRNFISETPYGDYEDWVRMNEIDKSKQGNITAHECQEILRILTLKNFEAPYKILILWLPEFLEKEGNRLLKIIEEPPDNTVFLFVANDQERIINTILSRLQMVKFPRLSEAEISSTLVEKHGLNPEQSKKLAAMSEGDFQAALHFLNTQEDGNTLLLQEWIHACRHSNVKALFAWNDKWIRLGRENQKSFLHYAMHFYRQMLLQAPGWMFQTNSHPLRSGRQEKWKVR